MWSVNFQNTSDILEYTQFPDSDLDGLDQQGGDNYTEYWLNVYSSSGYPNINGALPVL